ncbi:histone-lysine N-methyltransferase SETD1B-like [Brachypodium distachyon]|uniref:histone-lysine N-methyltransferase SETD1B-like n=1 Tax=Brachypodium distachyon TaxID=15368 RepID=UPI00053003C7|nr:histone-lysine N-methyltransferase SETD1B-like [Brachypodium distachyon]|eukprot:XP_010229846.1 histone-lysine N-methyltransferase SETD1B-like [Brachypodium distachyon]
MKQAAESMKADKAKSDARKKAAKEKSPEEQGGNEEVDREKTEYEKTRDAAHEIRREIGLKARNDPAAPSDTEENPRKKAIDTLVLDTSHVKLTSLLEEQEQAASSPTVLCEQTAQHEEGDEVLGKHKEDLTHPEEPPTSSSLPRTESVDASTKEGRTCDFEAEATRDLNVNDAETDADATVPTPEVRVKKAVKKKSVAPSDPSSSSDEDEEEKKEEEKEEK